jgi:hypothetical protein
MLLWISPHLLLAMVAIVMYRRRLYRDFPFFLVYTLFEIGEFALLYTLNSIPTITGQQYTYAFVSTLVISIALRFGVIRELSEDLFREHQFLKVAARQSLRWTKGILALIGVACAAFAPGEDGIQLMGGLAVINRGVAILQCGLLLFLLCFSRLLGLSWRGYSFGIALGLGVLSSVELATSAVRAEVAGVAWAAALNLLTTSSYLICALVWLGYFLAPERRPSVVADISSDEVRDWNRELQRWLKS